MNKFQSDAYRSYVDQEKKGYFYNQLIFLNYQIVLC